MVKELQDLRSRIVKMILDKAETVVRMRDIDSLQRWVGNITHYQDLFMAARDDFHCIYALEKRLLKSGSLSPKELTLISAFMYLLATEGHVCSVLNFVSYVLVTSGHDLYSLTKRKYMKDDMEEIRKVEMSTKIQFLKHHGFGALTKEYDSTFRNDIAHHNYKVDEEGALWVRGKPVDLASKIDKLIKIMAFSYDSLDEANKKLNILCSKLEKEVTKT